MEKLRLLENKNDVEYGVVKVSTVNREANGKSWEWSVSVMGTNTLLCMLSSVLKILFCNENHR